MRVWSSWQHPGQHWLHWLDICGYLDIGYQDIRISGYQVFISYCMSSWRPGFRQPGLAASCLYLASYTASAVWKHTEIELRVCTGSCTRFWWQLRKIECQNSKQTFPPGRWKTVAFSMRTKKYLSRDLMRYQWARGPALPVLTSAPILPNCPLVQWESSTREWMLRRPRWFRPGGWSLQSTGKMSVKSWTNY